MPLERLSDLPLDPSGPGPISHYVVALDERGRIRLPVSVVSSVSWLTKPGDGTTALMVLEVPGRLSLQSWEQFGEAVLARRRELLREAEQGNVAAEEDLLWLEDRYRRVLLPKERRLTLTAAGLLHLGIVEVEQSIDPDRRVVRGQPPPAHRLYLTRLFDRVVIMSQEYRDHSRRTGSVALSDLP
jgi:hypothetical protein